MRGKAMKIQKRLTGAEVMARWGVDEVTLGDFVLYEGLTAYDQYKHLIDIQEEIAKLHNEYLFKIYDWIGYDKSETSSVTYFRIEDIEAFEQNHPEIFDLPQGNPPENMVEKGRKGGLKSKKNQPILQATIKFIREKPDRLQKSAEKIYKALKRKYPSEEEQYEIIIDGVDYGVYCRDNEICAKTYKNKEAPVKTITSNTFKNEYISDAKEAVKSRKS